MLEAGTRGWRLELVDADPFCPPAPALLNCALTLLWSKAPAPVTAEGLPSASGVGLLPEGEG